MDNENQFLAELGVLTAALVLQRDDVAAETINRFHEAGVDREKVREAILQTYLFDGYPTALEGMRLLKQVWEGVASPTESGSYAQWEEWLKRGRQLYNQIYGNVAERLQKVAHEISPELADWMIVEGYGKVLSREGLGILAREFAIISVLIVKNRPRQLRSHIRGAIRIGAVREDFTQLFTSMENHLQYSNIEQAKSILNDLSGM